MTPKNVSLTTQASGITAFECPECGFWNLHQCGVEVFDRNGELLTDDRAEYGTHTTVEYGDGVSVDDSMESNPSGRRDGIKIHFWCEQCSDHPPEPTFVLNIVQHKGEERVYWQTEEDEDDE